MAKRDPRLMLLRLFQMQVLEQSEYLLAAMDRLRTSRADLWADMQTVVLAAGNLSKLLWGQAGSKAAERTNLRQSIGVTDSSPLRLPKVRNHFEHVDERLDTWWKRSKRHIFADRNIISRRSAVSGVEEIERFREYDPSTGNLWFWGDHMNLREIEAEVQRIIPALRREAAKPHWEP